MIANNSYQKMFQFNYSKMRMNNKYDALTTSKLEDEETLTQEVGDFYAWIRDHWTEMSCNDRGESTGMLNFGLWDKSTKKMFDAQENLRQLVANNLGELPPAARGLEIGCGIGGAAIKLVQERNVVLTCLDLVPAQLEIGREFARKAGVAGKIEFCPGSSMDMPLRDEMFDFSYCIESSFHYPDKLAFFRENFRVLKPGAVAVIADITCENNSLVTFKKGNYFCSADETRQLMLEAGFIVEEVICIGNQVFHPLRDYVENFNAGQRDKLYRYWNLVLRNYAKLFDQGNMGYEVFVLRKGGR